MDQAFPVMTIVGHRTVSMGNVQPDDLGEAETGAEGHAVDDVIAGVASGCDEDRRLLGCREGRRAEMRHATRVRRWGGKSRHLCAAIE